VGERIDIGELYRKRLFLNHSSASEAGNSRKNSLATVSEVADIAEAIELSTTRSQAQRILRDATKDARKLLRNARRKADNLHDAGRKRAEAERIKAVDEGYSSGYRNGLAKGESQFNQKLNELNQLLNSLRDDRGTVAANMGAEIAELVILMSQKVVGVLLEDKALMLRENIIAATKDSLAGVETITVRLSSDEYELLSADVSGLSAGSGCKVSVVCDSSLSTGECRILSPAGGIAFSFDQRFAIMKAELRKLL